MKQKVCKKCSLIYDGERCPSCGSSEYSEEAKGRMIIFDAEKSEIAQKVNIKKNGTYSIRSG